MMIQIDEIFAPVSESDQNQGSTVIAQHTEDRHTSVERTEVSYR
jgi:hypothetical protein